MENDVERTNLDGFAEERQNVETVTEAVQTVNQTASQRSNVNSEAIEELKSSQSIIGAVFGGFLGAAIGAALWAIVTAVTKYQIGYLAVGVGFLTGIMVRKLGHGFEKHFGYIGAVWSLLGCFGGNILAVLIMVSNKDNIPLITIFHLLKVSIIIEIVKESFNPMDIVFYGIALYEGYRFSFMKMNEINEKLNNIVNSRTYRP